MQKERAYLISILYIVTLSFLIYCIKSEIQIGRRFLKNRFYCYCQQIIFAVAKESLIPYNFTQKAPETQNLQYYKTKCHTKPNKTEMKYSSVFFQQQLLLHTNINIKNTYKLIYKRQYLKNDLQWQISFRHVNPAHIKGVIELKFFYNLRLYT